MYKPYEARVQHVFQAESHVIDVLKKIKDRVYHICRQYMGKQVRIQTISGEVYEGRIVNIDTKHVYLEVSSHTVQARGFVNPYFNPAANVILPLVLYELLVIALIS